MERLRVVTLNIWNRQGPWPRRRQLICQELSQLAPDLIGFQEVLGDKLSHENQAAEIAKELGYHVAFAPACTLGEQFLFGNAVLSRFPIVSERSWALPIEPKDESRNLLRVEVDAPALGRLNFWVTHLSWRLDQASIRLKQTRFIAERIGESQAGRNFPAILVGDFNAEPESDEIRFLGGHHVVDDQSVYFADCFRAAGQGAGYTFARRNPFALQAHEPNRRLDYIFIHDPNGQGRGEPLEAKVVFAEPDENNVFASDHFGVYAEIGTG